MKGVAEDKKILIVEDDEDLAFILSYIIKMKGRDVITFNNYKDFYNYINKNRDNNIIAFLDLVINNKNMTEDIKKIKKEFPDINLIITTAYPKYIESIKELHLKYILKPYGAEEILSFI